MKQRDLVAAGVAALMSGSLSIEAFADRPEAATRDHFGHEVDAQTIDEIGREFELLLAQTEIRPRPNIGGPRLPGQGPGLGPRGPRSVDDPATDDGPVYRCLTCI